jgi:hypothetical protein
MGFYIQNVKRLHGIFNLYYFAGIVRFDGYIYQPSLNLNPRLKNALS